ncbi:MAG TPA: AAA family ATPase [Desulfosporosinus sp.]|nr:AAA family ATPase [Desulfosporosinus sp.]
MNQKLLQLRESISHVVIGKEKALELVLVGLLAEGHILIDDVPGMGKTLLAKALAASLTCEFKRIQFTPDLTPTDVTGFFFYDHTKNFTFRPGPVLTNILLADEINRTVPRTQSALLEAMEERQITVDGQTMALPRPFLVLATQNPIDQEGTFPLPEAQLDRFLLKLDMGYPSFAEEAQILDLHQAGEPLSQLKPSAGADDVLIWQRMCRRVTIRPAVSSYLITLI